MKLNAKTIISIAVGTAFTAVIWVFVERRIHHHLNQTPNPND